jgi:hypothetical protein
MRAVPAPVEALGAQELALPTRSRLRNCTSLSPSLLTRTELPCTGLLQLEPPSVELRDSYQFAKPAPPLSVDPEAAIVSPSTRCQLRDPPLTLGAVGGVASTPLLTVKSSKLRLSGFDLLALVRPLAVVPRRPA